MRHDTKVSKSIYALFEQSLSLAIEDGWNEENYLVCFLYNTKLLHFGQSAHQDPPDGTDLPFSFLERSALNPLQAANFVAHSLPLRSLRVGKSIWDYTAAQRPEVEIPYGNVVHNICINNLE